MTGPYFVGYVVVYGGGAIVLWFIWAYIKYYRAHHLQLRNLLASGFTANHRVGTDSPVALFDDSRREMVIVEGPKLHRYSYDAIDSWCHECTIRNNRQGHHLLVITVLDTDYPRHEISVSADNARLWQAKLRAILAK